MSKSTMITDGIRKSFETGNSKMANKVCYGYSKASDGSLTIYVLSGLLICSECGSPYRRITRNTKDGEEIVWRCANRVEHWKEICQHSPTISD